MTEAETERAAVVAAEIRAAKRAAIKNADNSGWWPTIAAILFIAAIRSEFGPTASTWLGIGVLAALILFLWEAGRNSEIEQRATEQWAADFLARREHLSNEAKGG